MEFTSMPFAILPQVHITTSYLTFRKSSGTGLVRIAGISSRVVQCRGTDDDVSGGVTLLASASL